MNIATSQQLNAAMCAVHGHLAGATACGRCGKPFGHNPSAPTGPKPAPPANPPKVQNG